MSTDRRDRGRLRLRSLLEKALRRGYTQIVFTVCALLDSLGAGEKRWVRTRAPIIAFVECWPLGAEIVFNRRFHSKVALLVKVCRAAKNRDAAALGNLAVDLARGDRSVLAGSSDDRPLRVLASAVQRPEDFWGWARGQAAGTAAVPLVETAYQHRDATQPEERAAIQAAAYLAVTAGIPEVESADRDRRKFPYWIALDHRTREGRRALADTARDLHMDPVQLELAYQYFEGLVVDREQPSEWWQRDRRHRFHRAGIRAVEAHFLWEPARPQLKEALQVDAERLHRELYRWKMAHLDPIDSLKRQVEIFSSNFDKVQRSQGRLF